MSFVIGGCLTTKVALDGAWIGANHSNSYLAFAVAPGERHLCVNWQSHFRSHVKRFRTGAFHGQGR